MDFVATEWSSIRDKEEFSNCFIKFVESGFAKHSFTKKFYKRLSMCFGHIAHYNQDGFWGEWFLTADDRNRFMKWTLAWPCHGDPKFTYSDVEKYLITYFKKNPVKG